MPKTKDQIANLRVAAPCHVSWEGMAGDERVRHCTLCSLNVYNFAEMTRDEVRALLERTEGRVCGRLYRRADGTLLTRDCPTGLRALRRRASRAAAAMIAALLTLPSLAFGGTTCKKPRLDKNGSKVKFEIERVKNSELAVFNGLVRDTEGNALPGVNVTVRDETSEREVTVITDAKGAFNIPSLNDGIYRVDVSLDGFEPARIEHLRLKAGEVTHAGVALRIGSMTTMGVITVINPAVIRNDGMSTTFSQDFINKLPM